MTSERFRRLDQRQTPTADRRRRAGKQCLTLKPTVAVRRSASAARSAGRMPIAPDSCAAGLGVAELAQERPRDALDVGALLDGEIASEAPDRAVVKPRETHLER